MTDANALSEFVRAGLRNPAKVVVKVQLKKTRTGLRLTDEQCETIEERRVPARYFPLPPVWIHVDPQPCHSLQNFCLVCMTSEKVLQLSRLISNECESHDASRFIIYFATCACVDYFYRVRLLCASTPPLVILSCTDTSIINFTSRKAFLPPRPLAVWCPHKSPSVICISLCYPIRAGRVTDDRRCCSGT